MRIKIMSREKLEMISSQPFSLNTAVISITDVDALAVKIANKPQYLLRLSFDDVDPSEETIGERYALFTEMHAERIAVFYSDILNLAETLICQCEYGQSRSAAIAAAILEHSMHKGIDIFADSRYYPNKHVFRLTLAALRRRFANWRRSENEDERV